MCIYIYIFVYAYIYIYIYATYVYIHMQYIYIYIMDIMYLLLLTCGNHTSDTDNTKHDITQNTNANDAKSRQVDPNRPPIDNQDECSIAYYSIV